MGRQSADGHLIVKRMRAGQKVAVIENVTIWKESTWAAYADHGDDSHIVSGKEKYVADTINLNDYYLWQGKATDTNNYYSVYAIIWKIETTTDNKKKLYLRTKYFTMSTKGDPGDDALQYIIECDNETPNITNGAVNVTFTAYTQLGQQPRQKATIKAGALWWDVNQSSWLVNPMTLSVNKDTTVMLRTPSGIVATKHVTPVKDGKQGLQGCLMRLSEWVPGVEYHNDEALTSGTRYLDIAVVTTSATTHNAYKCRVTHTSTTDNAPVAGSTTTQWEPFNGMAPIYTPLLLAANALIRLAQTNQLLVMKTDGTTVNAGMGGGDIPLWVGNNEPIKAPFYVDANGHLCATGAKVEGEVNATSGTFKNVIINGSYRSPWQVPNNSLDTETSDNIALISNVGGGWVLAYSLKWDATQSGRILRITNYKWKNNISNGYSSIAAPSGKYFFEDGIAKNKLKMSREVVELLGYGDENNFYGWIILKRNDLMSSYANGSPLKCVAFGKVIGTDKSALIQQSTFDGKAIKVERQDTGIYKLTMPTSWFADNNSMPFIMVCGYGNTYGDSSPQKATVRDVTATTFLVDCSDDASRNDGNFQFMIYNQYMWGQ